MRRIYNKRCIQIKENLGKGIQTGKCIILNQSKSLTVMRVYTAVIYVTKDDDDDDKTRL